MYGKQFAANSFALPDRPTPKDYYKDVGDDNLTLLERLPLSLRADPPRGDVPYESRDTAATGEPFWMTPIFNNTGNTASIKLHYQKAGLIVEVRSINPYEMFLARFAADSGRLAASVGIVGGHNLNDASIRAGRIIVTNSKHWFVLDEQTLDVVASSASAEEQRSEIEPGREHVRALLKLPNAALPKKGH